MNIFWILVKNDLGMAKNNSKHSILWKKIFGFLGLIGGFVLYTIALLHGKTTPDLISIVPVFLIFLSFPISLRLLKREWSGNTIGWWLQLPYSRKILLGAKFTAGLIRFLKIATIVLLISLIFWFGGLLISPDIWSQYSLAESFLKLIRIYLQILSICPLLIVFGMLTVILQKTKFSVIIPFFWVIYGVIMSIFSTTFFKTNINFGSDFTWVLKIAGLSVGISYLVEILLVLIITGLVFRFAVFLMEKYVEA